ncbi:MAG: alpha/beta hydrolase [Leptolyngbya sp. DLM2.Bin27]|nr:MAG: alpha/beta hydrolase [Leptolyngbya sp. DLM2.Bin27]
MAFFRSVLTRLGSGTLAATLGLAGLGLGLAQIQPQPAYGAEAFTVRLTGPLVLRLSVDSLATFAETGEATGNFRLLARFLDDEALAGLRPLLNFRFPIDVRTAGNLSYSPLGRDVMANLGMVFQSQPGENGFYAMRAAVINAAAQAGPEGWTLIDVMRAFPADSISVNIQGLRDLQRELAIYLSYNRAAVAAIRAQADAEAAAPADLSLADLPDLSQPGGYGFSQTTLTVANPALRQTQAGLSVNYDFNVDVYLPEGRSGPAPIVIVSHGFGAVKEDFVFLNQHLASHGYVVLAPDHVGSNLSYRREFLGGRLNTLLSPIEFINRPREISFLIDELERRVASSPDWAARLDLDRIAAIGDSLGSSTVMALAGANLNRARIVEACDRTTFTLSFPLYLQCRARFLPPKDFDLGDPRIKAVVAAHNMGAALYGPEGVSQIEIPMLMVAGSIDVTSPVVTEQIAPFIWLETDDRYLALLQQGTHFSSKPAGEGAGDVPAILMGAHRDVGSAYYKTLTTAFLGAHLQADSRYLPYLSAAYARAISADQPMVVDVITSLSAAQVNAAYAGTPPVALRPPLPPPAAPRTESILTAIARTGEIRVAMRRDAPPFGYGSDAGWTGYCPALVVALRDYVQQELGSNIALELVELPSTLGDRFDLVRDGQVYLECGPNTVRDGVEGIAFSSLIFASGTHFLTTPARAPGVNPALSLRGVNVGVLANSTNEVVLQDRYPAATITRFDGPTGRTDAIQAVSSGQLDAFFGDDVLLLGELVQRGLAEFTLVPELPLTCEYYSLALPSNDPAWAATVNGFLRTEASDRTRSTWLGDFLPHALTTLNHCFNR